MRRLLPFLLLWLLVPVVVADEGAGDLRGHIPNGDHLLKLWADDRIAFDAYAARRFADPFLVADRLLAHAQSGGDVGMDVVAAFVDARREKHDHAALIQWLDVWSDADPESVASECRLREAAEEAAKNRWRFERGRVATLELAKERADDIAAAGEYSLNALRLRHRAEVSRGSEATIESACENLMALLEDAERIGWSLFASEMAGTFAAVAINGGRVDDSVAASRRQIQHLRDTGAKGAVGVARAIFAGRLRRAGRMAEALDEAYGAQAELEALGEPGGRARAQWTLASLHVTLVNLQAAVDAFEQAIALARGTIQEGWIPRMQLELGDAYRRLGRYADALVLFEEVEASRVAQMNASTRAMCLAYRATVMRELGRHDDALALLEQGRDLLDDPRFRTTKPTVLGRLALTLYDLGRIDEAIEVLTASRAIEVETANATDVVTADMLLASMERDRGNLDAARGHIANARAGAERSGLAAPLAFLRLLEARIQADAGEYDAAREGLTAFLGAVDDLHLSEGWASAVLQDLALLADRTGRSVDAFTHSLRALEIRLRFTSGLDDVEALGFRAKSAELVDVGVRGVMAAYADGALDGAGAARNVHALIEAGRAVILAEHLGNADALIEASVPRAVRDAEALARRHLEGAQERLVRLAFGPDEVEGELLASARLAVEEAHTAHADAVATLRRAAGRAASLVPVEPLPLERVALADDEAFVAYHLGAEQAVAVVKSGTTADVVPLGRTDALVARVGAWLALAKGDGTADEHAASACYDAVLKPLERGIGHAQRLVVSPDGVLAFLPFDALVRRTARGTQRVVERHEVVFVPSATVRSLLRADVAARTRGTGIVALGDPVYPTEVEGELPPLIASRGLAALPRLVESGKEAQAIAALFPEGDRTVLLRDDATIAGLLEATAPREGAGLAALHVGCHAFVDREQPRLSGLVLAGGEVLSVASIGRAQIAADLAVLSACDTGQGTIAKGEGVIGLSRAFFHAGVPRVVVSTWKVDDTSTRELMEAFYRHMRKGGLAPGAALRAAKRERLAAGCHPYHWAAFVLWGP